MNNDGMQSLISASRNNLEETASFIYMQIQIWTRRKAVKEKSIKVL